MGDLFERWQTLSAALAAPGVVAEEWYRRLRAAWGSPDRHYHTLDHLAAVLGLLDDVEARDPAVLRLAAWFHDAVYDPRAADNEERSADLARLCAGELGLSAPRSDETVRLILLTKTHRAETEDIDGQTLLDADLAVLGTPPDAYDRYADAIRREYAWVPEEQYRQGRARVLQSFLERPRIYHRPALAERLEAAARANLRRELDRLSALPSPPSPLYSGERGRG